MIATTKCAGFFERQNIGGLFHHAKDILRPGRVRADIAKLGRGKKTATDTRPDLRSHRDHRPGNLFRLVAAGLHHPQGNALGRPRPNPGHLAQLND